MDRKYEVLSIESKWQNLVPSKTEDTWSFPQYIARYLQIIHSRTPWILCTTLGWEPVFKELPGPRASPENGFKSYPRFKICLIWKYIRNPWRSLPWRTKDPPMPQIRQKSFLPTLTMGIFSQKEFQQETEQPSLNQNTEPRDLENLQYLT